MTLRRETEAETAAKLGRSNLTVRRHLAQSIRYRPALLITTHCGLELRKVQTFHEREDVITCPQCLAVVAASNAEAR